MRVAHRRSAFLLVLGIMVVSVEFVLGGRALASASLEATTSVGPTYLPCVAVRSIVVDGERVEISRVALQRATLVALTLSVGTYIIDLAKQHRGGHSSGP